MDRLEAMSTFLAVVEDGSLSAAARRLKTPLPTVSRKISELESSLQKNNEDTDKRLTEIKGPEAVKQAEAKRKECEAKERWSESE